MRQNLPERFRGTNTRYPCNSEYDSFANNNQVALTIVYTILD